MSCVGRVWRNGDYTNCGKLTIGENQHCGNCIAHLLSHHRHEVTKLSAELATHEAKIAELEREQRRR